VDILVTSVHQTTAGKMIFGRLDERQEVSASPHRQAAAAAAASGGGISTTRAELPARMENGSRLAESSQLERGQRPVFPESEAD